MVVRFLIVDDEFLIADDICGLIEHEFPQSTTTQAGRLEEALDRLEEADFDAAVLDANLHGQSSQPIAQTLEKKRVPFFVVTGHLKPSRLPPPLNAVEIVAKPYRDPQMIECLRRLAKAATNGGDMRVSESARDLAARD